MASKRPQTIAKRARELAVKEKRERKRAKKAEAAALRAAGGKPFTDDGADPTFSPTETAEAQVPTSEPEETS